MIHNTSTVTIDGNVFKNEELAKVFTLDKDDKYSQWVLRPLAVVIAVGMGMATFFAGAFIIALSLALLPLMAVAFWAFKIKLKRDLARANPVVDTQTSDNTAKGDNAQAAG